MGRWGESGRAAPGPAEGSWWAHMKKVAAPGNGIKVLAEGQDLPGHEAVKEANRPHDGEALFGLGFPSAMGNSELTSDYRQLANVSRG